MIGRSALPEILRKKPVAMFIEAPFIFFTENVMSGFFLQIFSGWFRLSINATKIEKTNVLTISS